MYKLLIVDDEPRIVEGLKLILNWEDYDICQIETATDFNEAVSKAIDFCPDIAIVDVCIHEEKGYDLIGYLRKFRLPTQYIMISGYDEFKYVKAALEKGVKNYIVKPISKAELTETIERIIVEDLHGELKEVKKDNFDTILGKEYDKLSKLTQKIIMMVHQCYGDNISLKSIGEDFKMNSNYLGQLFMKDTGMKFSEYLMKYRMLKAKYLIETTSEKIIVIAKAVGYTNLNYFYTHFQMCYEASPSEFRH